MNGRDGWNEGSLDTNDNDVAVATNNMACLHMGYFGHGGSGRGALPGS